MERRLILKGKAWFLHPTVWLYHPYSTPPLHPMNPPIIITFIHSIWLWSAFRAPLMVFTTLINKEWSTWSLEVKKLMQFSSAVGCNPNRNMKNDSLLTLEHYTVAQSIRLCTSVVHLQPSLRWRMHLTRLETICRFVSLSHIPKGGEDWSAVSPFNLAQMAVLELVWFFSWKKWWLASTNHHQEATNLA